MKYDKSKTAAAWAVVVLIGAVGIQALKAQQTASVTRNILLKQDMVIPGREAVMATVDLPPGSAEVRHTHPAEVYVFVQEGAISLETEGKPTATFKAGDVFYIAPGRIHQAANKGNVPARLAVVFVAEKGKPLTTQVQ
jgi:quercetin dioxygenase-like cupin family protein